MSERTPAVNLHRLLREIIKLEDKIEQAKNELRDLKANWDLEERVLSHLLSLGREACSDENIFRRYMQSSIACNKRYPKETKEQERLQQRLTAERLQLIQELRELLETF